jgi:hypothetical protein
VLHDQEQQSALEESIVGETQQHAPEEQEALEEQEAREEKSGARSGRGHHLRMVTRRVSNRGGRPPTASDQLQVS